MEIIIGLAALLLSGLYFYVMVFHVLFKPELWKLVIYKPYKGKIYREIDVHVVMPIAALLSGVLFIIIAHFGFAGSYHSFAWFLLGFATPLILWSVYVAFVSDKGFFVVAIILILFNYVLYRMVLNTNEILCWITLGISVICALYGWFKKKKF